MKQSEIDDKFKYALPRAEKLKREHSARQYDKREDNEQALLNLRIAAGLIGPAERAELQKRAAHKRYEKRKTRNVSA